jgi:hypothetical protein
MINGTKWDLEGYFLGFRLLSGWLLDIPLCRGQGATGREMKGRSTHITDRSNHLSVVSVPPFLTCSFLGVEGWFNWRHRPRLGRAPGYNHVWLGDEEQDLNRLTDIWHGVCLGYPSVAATKGHVHVLGTG